MEAAQLAQKAHNDHDLPYAGDVLPEEAWKCLSEDPNAILIDVRTQPEWVFVGAPNLTSIGKQALAISWKMYPTFETNPQFVEQLKTHGISDETPMFFLCRSGGRSLDAAMAVSAEGYRYCFNIAGGFEGEPDEAGHRGVQGCWKSADLPWGQN